jgi:hypothetical protein
MAKADDTGLDTLLTDLTDDLLLTDTVRLTKDMGR